MVSTSVIQDCPEYVILRLHTSLTTQCKHFTDIVKLFRLSFQYKLIYYQSMERVCPIIWTMSAQILKLVWFEESTILWI